MEDKEELPIHYVTMNNKKEREKKKLLKTSEDFLLFLLDKKCTKIDLHRKITDGTIVSEIINDDLYQKKSKIFEKYKNIITYLSSTPEPFKDYQNFHPIPQKGLGISDKCPLYTGGTKECVSIAGHNKKTGKIFLTHIDRGTNPNSVYEKMKVFQGDSDPSQVTYTLFSLYQSSLLLDIADTIKKNNNHLDKIYTTPSFSEFKPTGEKNKSWGVPFIPKGDGDAYMSIVEIRELSIAFAIDLKGKVSFGALPLKDFTDHVNKANTKNESLTISWFFVAKFMKDLKENHDIVDFSDGLKN